MASSKKNFTGNDKGLIIQELLERQKSLWPKHWKGFVVAYFKDEVTTWWKSLNRMKWLNPPKEEFEKLLLDKWSHARK